MDENTTFRVNSMLGAIELSDRLYTQFAKLVYDLAGISLGDAKRDLVRARLLKRLRAMNFDTFERYYKYLSEEDTTGDELVHMLDAISTNKTDFFRESQHFSFLSETVLPNLIQKGNNKGARKMRVWSAGCSSGEEPYTLAMVLKEALSSQAGWDVKILATDLSTRVLRVAKEGIYEEEKAAAIPPKMRFSYMSKEKIDGQSYFRVKSEVQDMITFRRFNLMEPAYPFQGKFDIIFCRNVMIYFDKPTQEALVNKFHNFLTPGGYLFIGHSESLTSLKVPFQFVKPTVYLKAL